MPRHVDKLVLELQIYNTEVLSGSISCVKDQCLKSLNQSVLTLIPLYGSDQYGLIDITLHYKYYLIAHHLPINDGHRCLPQKKKNGTKQRDLKAFYSMRNFVASSIFFLVEKRRSNHSCSWFILC